MKIRNCFLVIVIILGFIFISKPVFSQSFHGGPLLGFSATQIDGEGQNGYNKFGLVVGGFVNHKISGGFDAQFELKFIQKGSRQTAKSSNNYFSWKIALNYVEMPLFVKYSFNEKRKKLKKIVPEAGLTLSYLANYTYSDYNGPLINIINPYNKFDYGVLVGVSYKLNEKLSVNLRYTYSFLSILKHHYYGRGQFNKVLAFTANYQF
jgi:opacity protein-like surface antigen